MQLFNPDNPPIARASDPHTSHLAAQQVDRKVTDKHRGLLAYYVNNGPQTDDQASEWAVRQNLYTRHEQARRAIRTLRDHDLLTLCLDIDGTPMTDVNSSGRSAQLWHSTFKADALFRVFPPLRCPKCHKAGGHNCES